MRFGRSVVGVGALTLAGGHRLLLIALQSFGAKASLASLVPGLLLVGAGMGLCITPLATVVLSTAGPQHAGSVSGPMSTVQQIGNAVTVLPAGGGEDQPWFTPSDREKGYSLA